jgi:hypothetical protein
MSYDPTIDVNIVLFQIEYKMWFNHQAKKSKINSLVQNELNTNWGITTDFLGQA